MPVTPAPIASIVIPVYNQLEFTRQCLDSLKQFDELNSEIIIVDNGSGDGTAEYLQYLSGYEIISNAVNRGCAAGWNQGVERATGDWIVILNNDVILTKSWLPTLLEVASKENLDIISPAIREFELNYGLDTYANEFTSKMKGIIRLGLADGICFAVHRRVFDKIGLFDENFRIGQFEDADFFRRARMAGFRLGTVGDVLIHHFGSITQKAIKKDNSKSDYEAANRSYFRSKWNQNWLRRKFEKAVWSIRFSRWRRRELKKGHTLKEKFIDGRLRYF